MLAMNSPLFSILFRGARRILCVALLITAAARADVVFAWNEALLQAWAARSQPMAAHDLARVFAIAHLAMEEALATRPAPATPAEHLAADRIAVISAAHTILTTLLPEFRSNFDRLQATHFAAISGTAANSPAAASGRAAAMLILQRREKDGWRQLTLLAPPFGPAPDASQENADALMRGANPPPSPWLAATPFAVKSVAQFNLAELRTHTKDGEAFPNRAVVKSKLFDTVDRAGAADAADGCWSQQPLVVWNRIARQLAAVRQLDLREQAQLLALVNVTLADATLATLHARHVVGSWRVIRTEFWRTFDGVVVDSGTHIESDFVQGLRRETHAILLPPTPSYPSLAASLAGAAQAVLTSFFRTDEIGFTVPWDGGGLPKAANVNRAFVRVSQAAKEHAFVASLGERYSREACVAGYLLGADVGNSVARRKATIARR